MDSLLLAIGVHGPSVIYEHADNLRELYRNERTSFMEVQACLEEEGITRDDIWRLVNIDKHPMDCACWTCIGRLQLQIMRHHAEMAVRLKGAAADEAA